MKIKPENETLVELIVGIFVYGAAAEAAGLIFTKDKGAFSIALFLGIFAAVGMAAHMAHTMSIAIELPEKSMSGYMSKQTMLRYFAVAAFLYVIAVWGVVNPLYTFFGIMGLKVAAYIQPFTHKVIAKIQKK